MRNTYDSNRRKKEMRVLLLLLHLWFFDTIDVHSMIVVEYALIACASVLMNYSSREVDPTSSLLLSVNVFPILINISLLTFVRLEQTSMQMPSNITEEGLRVILAFLFSNVWFYFSHRLFHCRMLYKKFHYMHHRFNAKNAFGAFFSHPFEFLCCNLPAMIAPLFFGCCDRVLHAYCFVSCLNIVLAHSNTEITFMKKSLFHQRHHSMYSKNFGLNTMVLDKMFSTFCNDSS